MKKHLLPFAFVLASCGTASAQLHNGGFEDLNETGFPAYWQGTSLLTVIIIDSNGVAHGDSIVMDGGSNYSLITDDVHSGANAVELRNGFNFTTGQAIPGGWMAANDSSIYNGFNTVFLGTDERPLMLGFFAKYLPVSGDVGYVRMDVYDETQEIVGTGETTISGTFAEYTEFQVPIEYNSSGTPIMFTLNFNTAAPSTPATLGTRLLIDDVSLLQGPLGVSEQDAGPALDIFPNPAQNSFTVRNASAAPVRDLRIIDLSGREQPVVRNADGGFGCAQLANGTYALRIRTAEGEGRRLLMVEH